MFANRNVIHSVGNQIGVGKESGMLVYAIILSLQYVVAISLPLPLCVHEHHVSFLPGTLQIFI